MRVLRLGLGIANVTRTCAAPCSSIAELAVQFLELAAEPLLG